ncbi:hypothetical protein NUTIK01_26100 [Novosphingobium sp. IK01]|uniref:Uncharacterized protein n=2 Tax=Novosphingobium pituita TaxID=3056842 RepID=A0ABQ6P987_9SPHN|nr:hypothetical protein NUTIK01_26100 [Novosphingobium sp. IK01]
MALDEGLQAFTGKGRVQPHTSVIAVIAYLIEEAGESSGDKIDALIRREFPHAVAERLVSKDPFDRFDDEPVVWDEMDGPLPIDPGFFLVADEIDWDAGTLMASYIPGEGDLRDSFFPDSTFLQTELERAEFSAVLEGLSFEAARIELLLPSFTLKQNMGFTAFQAERRSPVGRPPKWDWEGAMAHIAAIAHHPDGLPTGPGAQARIEELIANWFNSQVQDTPAVSQIRQRAAKIMRMVEKPKTD